MSSSSLIWFQLVDAADGKPYKDTSVSSVLRFSLVVPVVDQFRKAVKSKFADSLLNGVAPSNLLVYKNKAAFDKRNAAVDEGKEEPLEEDSLIDNFGATKKEALVVVVPRMMTGMLESRKRHMDSASSEMMEEKQPCGSLANDHLLQTSAGECNPTLKDAFESYRKTGEKMKDSEQVRHILNGIECLLGKGRPFGFPPFMFFDASSGIGKTQTAFALMAAFNYKNIFYFHCLNLAHSENPQPILADHASASAFFLQCVKRDVALIESPKDLTCASLCKKSLWTFGFVQCLFEHAKKPSLGTYVAKRCSISEIGERPNLFIIILDEFLTYDDMKRAEYHENHLRFMRNIFRALKGLVIILGTNSRAANLVETKSGMNASRGSDIPMIWCAIYHKFPPVELDMIGSPKQIPCPLRNILLHSRPWFSKLAVDNLNNFGGTVDEYDKLFLKVAKRITIAKNIFDDDDGFHGQLCLFLNGHYKCDIKEQNDNGTALINKHFAMLQTTSNPICVSPELYVVATMTPNHERDHSFVEWEPRTAFPKVETDVLLYLCLMGCKNFSPLQDKRNKALTFYESITRFRSSNIFRRAMINYKNVQQNNNDGTFMEALICGVACIASRTNGIGGMDGVVFLQNIVNQFFSGTLCDPDNLMSPLAKVKIGYLAPPNETWPAFLEHIAGSSWGIIERTKNDTRVDAKIMTAFGPSDRAPMVVIESKDHKKALDVGIVMEILDRAMGYDSRLHLIVSNRLQREYFTMPSTQQRFQEFKGKNDEALKRTCIVKIFSKDDKPTVSYIGGIDVRAVNPDKIIVFLETELFPSHLQ